VAARQTRLTPQDHQDIRQQFAYKTGSLFESIWQQYLNDNEKQALLQLISGQVVDRSMVSELARKGYVVGKRVFSAPFAEMLLQEKSANTWTMHLDEQGELWLNGNKLNPPLTKSQHHLLTYLYENSERVCEKDEIANSVWGSANMDKIDDERIAKLVSRLRERIEPDPDKPRYLLTAHGRGYRLMRQQKEAERKE
jgi:DNA-binding winged helix-turn-helix (wHTH) protein